LFPLRRKKGKLHCPEDTLSGESTTGQSESGQVRELEERLRLVRIEKYEPGSEKLSDDQLELLELEPGVSSAEVEAESQRQQLELPLRKPRKHPGRQQLPAELPRVEQLITCTADQCVCGKCGKETTVIGYETSEQLDSEICGNTPCLIFSCNLLKGMNSTRPLYDSRLAVPGK